MSTNAQFVGAAGKIASAQQTASNGGKRSANQLGDAGGLDTVHEVGTDVAKTVSYIKSAYEAMAERLDQQEDLVTTELLDEIGTFSDKLRSMAIKHVAHVRVLSQIGKLKTRMDDVDGGYPGAPSSKIRKAYAMATNYSFRFKEELDNERVEWKQKKEQEGLLKAQQEQKKRDTRNQELDPGGASKPLVKKPRIQIPTPLDLADP